MKLAGEIRREQNLIHVKTGEEKRESNIKIEYSQGRRG